MPSPWTQCPLAYYVTSCSSRSSRRPRIGWTSSRSRRSIENGLELFRTCIEKRFLAIIETFPLRGMRSSEGRPHEVSNLLHLYRGSIGGTIAAYLTRTDATVSVVARGETLAALKMHGLRLISDGQIVKAHISE